MCNIRSGLFLLAAGASSAVILGYTGPAASAAGVRDLFANPPREYSSGPLWVWNDMLTEEQVIRSLRELHDQHIRQVWVHPRPGLMTPYLGDEWFKLWQATLDEARKLDMNVWIYDENSYPSGFAGGFVPEAMPESRGQGLNFAMEKAAPKWSDELMSVSQIADTTCEDVTARVKAGETLPAGQYLVCRIKLAPIQPWNANRFYVDLLRPGVTQKFIEVTFAPYRKHFAAEFGKRIPGSFTDEPEITPAGAFPWTPDLPEQFHKRWGYDLTANLACLAWETGDWKQVRHDYYATLLDLFGERWGKPMHDYLDAQGLEFTGHYWEHSWPNCVSVPDNMSMYQWFHRPGIDTLFNQYSEGPHAQFGNVRAVRELASVANQLGKKRTLCEAYGAGGWDLRFEDMKRIGDWMYALGVNTLNQHLSDITIRGARKRDHPQSFTAHEPWWEAYHLQADYFARLSAALSAGEQINRILVIEPTSTAWMYQTANAGHPKLKELGETFQKLVTTLDQRQVEYDLGSEDLMARFGSVTGKRLVVGKRSYEVAVIPPLTETLNAKAAGLLGAFLKGGGKVICTGEIPAMVSARPNDVVATMAKLPGWQQADAPALPEMLLALQGDGLVIRQAESDKGIVYHMRRQMADGDLLFIVNTSIEHLAKGVIAAKAGGMERWDPQTGRISGYTFERGAGAITAKFDLPPCGSLLLFVSKIPLASASEIIETATIIQPSGERTIRRDQPNVLTLDYVDLTAGKASREGIHSCKANDLAFQANGLKGNPWDCAVQFRDEIITQKFPLESGCEVSYRFTIADRVPDSLFVVIERPDLYRITCNGQEVHAAPGAWWLEPSFGKLDIRSAAKVGENVVTCKASPFTVWHEIEAAYVLGDFAVQPAEQGFVIKPPSPVKLGPWNVQGKPFYGATVTYSERFDLPTPSGRYVVSLPAWYGSVAKVVVNGKLAGYIQSQPWECDVTPHITGGINTVSVSVFGTLKNTLGPHHENPPAGIAWPHGFRKAPETGPPAGVAYSTFGYGLFEPFVIRHMTKSNE